MSKIQTIQPNYQPAAQARLKKQNSPSFAAVVPASLADDLEKAVLLKVGEKVDKKLGKTGWVSQKLSDTKGELQTQLINNLFTATLAPAVIAWNPISKDDKKTKYYSAWRQPISVATAMLINFPLTMLCNSYISKLSSVGAIKSLDSRVDPDKDYLKGQFSAELKELKKNKKSADEIKAFLESSNNAAKDKKYTGSDLFKSDGITPTKKYAKACTEGYINKAKSDRKALFGVLFGEHPDNIIFNNGVISVKNADGSLKDLGKNIPGFEKAEELKAYLKENNLYEKNTRDFMKETFKFEFFEDGEMKPSINQDALGKTKAMDFMRKFGIFESDNVTEKDLKEIMANLHGDKSVSELESSFGDLKSPEKAVKTIGKMVSRGSQSEVGEGFSLLEKISLKQLFHNLGYKSKDGSLQELMDKKMSVAQLEIAEKIKIQAKKYSNDKMSKYMESKTIKDFAMNVLANKIKTVSKNFGNYKAYFGIFTNLFILAATCTALNWVYPRFMEIFLPDLADAKKKGGNK